MSFNFANIDNKSFIINLLFSFLVFSFIAGNMVLNINILLIIVFSIFFYKKNIVDTNFDLIDKVIVIFFFYALLSGILNNIYYKIIDPSEDYTVLVKTIFYLRFLLIYFIIKFLIKEGIINLKIFFIISSFAVIFVCLDLIYQMIFGYDIFGFKAGIRRLSGPFGDELIAGSFIQRFGLFPLFLLPVFFKFKKNYFLNLILISLVGLLLFSLIIAGNRIPLILFVLILVGIVIFEKKLRNYLFIILILFPTIFISTYYLDKDIAVHIRSFKKNVTEMIMVISPENEITRRMLDNDYKNYMFYTFKYKDKYYRMVNTHLKEFKTGYVTWQDNFIFGGGIKSFTKSCRRAEIKNCVNHPHNYYLEILAELGLIGFMISVILFFIVFFKTFIKKYFKDSNLKNYHIITPFIFLFFAEVFPLKSTGSFFTTNNATYIFLILSILASLLKIKEKY
tara:strand:- start:1093 stop:2442 length:1350 start_codon:yes stop_codon:yes gene_type:complete